MRERLPFQCGSRHTPHEIECVSEARVESVEGQLVVDPERGEVLRRYSGDGDDVVLWRAGRAGREDRGWRFQSITAWGIGNGTSRSLTFFTVARSTR